LSNGFNGLKLSIDDDVDDDVISECQLGEAAVGKMFLRSVITAYKGKFYALIVRLRPDRFHNYSGTLSIMSLTVS
jgi:hypothetical protein